MKKNLMTLIIMIAMIAFIGCDNMMNPNTDDYNGNGNGNGSTNCTVCGVYPSICEYENLCNICEADPCECEEEWTGFDHTSEFVKEILRDSFWVFDGRRLDGNWRQIRFGSNLRIGMRINRTTIGPEGVHPVHEVTFHEDRIVSATLPEWHIRVKKENNVYVLYVMFSNLSDTTWFRFVAW